MSDGKNISGGFKASPYILAAALLIFASALRLIRINQGFWYDELHSYLQFVTAPWREIVTYVPVPNNHILYSLLAKLCESWFGRAEWSIRLPALIAGAATPALAFFLLRRRMGNFSAFLAGLFLALNYWMVWFSQDARGYSSFILFSMLGNIFYLEWLENKKSSYGAGYFLCSVIGCYFYFYNGFVISSQIAYGLLLWTRRKSEISPRVFILPIAALIFSALLYAIPSHEMIQYVDRVHNIIKAIGFRAFNLLFFKELLKLMTGSRQLWLGLPVLALFAAGLPRLYRKWPGLCSLYFLAVIFMVGFTLAMRVFIHARFLSFAVPLFALGVAEGLAAINDLCKKRIPFLKPNLAGIIGALALCSVLAFGLASYYLLGKQGYKDAVNYAAENYPGRTIVSFGLASQELLYYSPTAAPWPNKKAFEPADLIGNIVVTSYPSGWVKRNMDMIRKYCLLEKAWGSMSDEGLEVYLFKCFK